MVFGLVALGSNQKESDNWARESAPNYLGQNRYLSKTDRLGRGESRRGWGPRIQAGYRDSMAGCIHSCKQGSPLPLPSADGAYRGRPIIEAAAIARHRLQLHAHSEGTIQKGVSREQCGRTRQARGCSAPRLLCPRLDQGWILDGVLTGFLLSPWKYKFVNGYLMRLLSTQ